MLKVLYISIYNKTQEALLSDGVMKKITLHIECLKRLGDEVDYFYHDGSNVFISENGQDTMLAKKVTKPFLYFNQLMKLAKKVIKAKNKKYDFVYIRFVAFDFFGFNALKYIRKHTNRIYLEFPTFFIPEKNLKNLIKFHYNKYIHKFIDKAVLDGLDNEAYKMPTLKIINGTDLSKISPKKPIFCDEINVLLVAFIQDYHGVDKIINATKNYYENGGKRNVVFHIVGEGENLQKFISDVKKNNIDGHFVFYGKLPTDKMFEVFDKCELGISSLSNKEIGVTCSSTLKSKEYLAKGLPIISDTMLDVFVDNPKYFFHILEKNFTIKEMVEFYDVVYRNNDKQKIINDIREFADQTCDMFKVFRGVHDDYLLSIKNGDASL